MKIKENSKVTLICEIRENNQNGQIVEEITADNPLVFTYGNNELFEIFEEEIKGLEAKNKFEFSVDADNAFGEYDEDSVVEISFDSLINIDEDEDSDLEVGQVLSLEEEDDEEASLGVISQLNHENRIATIDFNHPFAGMNLYIKGEIIKVE